MSDKALISGQAGVAVLLRDGHARSFYLDGPVGVECSLEGIGRIFGDCTDVLELDDIGQENISARLELEWAKQRCLALCLLLLDVGSHPESRSLAVPDVEEFLKIPEIANFIRGRLFVAPMPENADMIGAINLAHNQSADSLVSLLEEVGACQNEISRCRLAWDALPSQAFPDESSKEDVAFELVQAGAFLRVVKTASAKRSALLIDLLQRPRFRKWRVVLTTWINSLSIKNRAANRPAEEEAETSSSRRHHFKQARLGAEEQLDVVDRQKEAIRKALTTGDLNRARGFCADLLAYQERNSRPEHIAKTLCDLAQAAKQLGYNQLQLEWARKAVEVMPGDGWALAQLGDAHRCLDHWHEAEQAFALAARHGQELVARTGRAEVLKALGRLDDALQEYDSIAKEFSQDIVARNGRAEVLKAMGRLEDALREYELTAKEFPQDVFARTGAASVCVLLADYDRASDWIGPCADVEPVNWVGLHILGMIRLRTGRAAEAVALFERGLRDGPYTGRHYFRSSLAYARLLAHDLENAAKVLEEEPSLVSRVLQIHIYGELKQTDKARRAYEGVRSNRNPRVIELTAELTARARLERWSPRRSDQWVLDREFELLLAA